jgi:hypothetical protein
MQLSKHATAVAYLALFVALGGTSYAVTGGNLVLGHANQAGAPSSLKNTGAGPALKLTSRNGTTPALAVSNSSKIAHLNADELDGLSSSAFQRKVAGIFASTTSPNTTPAGSVGPWSVSLNCNSTGFARIKITGPGSAGGTTSRSVNEGAANTFVGALAPIGAGYLATADTDEQVNLTVFLKSGSTLAEVNLLLTANNGGLFENCDAIGSATLFAS